MAMIEVRDLVAPLSSRTNLVSMALAIALFTAFRIAGGGVSLQLPSPAGLFKGSATVDDSEASPFQGLEEEEVAVDGEGTGARADSPPTADSSGFIEQDEDLDPLFNGSPQTGKGKAAKPSNRRKIENDEDKGGFADIERQLGLR